MEETLLDLDEALVEVGRAVIWKATDTDYSVTIGIPERSRWTTLRFGRAGDGGQEAGCQAR